MLLPASLNSRLKQRPPWQRRRPPRRTQLRLLIPLPPPTLLQPKTHPLPTLLRLKTHPLSRARNRPRRARRRQTLILSLLLPPPQLRPQMGVRSPQTIPRPPTLTTNPLPHRRFRTCSTCSNNGARFRRSRIRPPSSNINSSPPPTSPLPTEGGESPPCHLLLPKRKVTTSRRARASRGEKLAAL